MKIEEAKKELVKNKKYVSGCFDDEHCKQSFNDGIDLALNIIDQTEPYQPKPVVPKFVAEWLKKYKEEGCRLSYALEHVFDDVELSLYIKQQEGDYTEIIAEAWLAYPNVTVEKEKLYTVDVPNPNSYQKTMLIRRSTGIYLDIFDIDYHTIHFALTEQEIRKDFDWAWEQGFAKEVTE